MNRKQVRADGAKLPSPIEFSAEVSRSESTESEWDDDALDPEHKGAAAVSADGMKLHDAQLAATSSMPARAPQHDDDDEIARFDDNAHNLETSERLFQIERQVRHYDVAETERLQNELTDFASQLPFEVASHVFCTQSICEVKWTSGAPIEEMIPELVPWILTQPEYAVDDGKSAVDDEPSADGSGEPPDDSSQLRFLFRRRT